MTLFDARRLLRKKIPVDLKHLIPYGLLLIGGCLLLLNAGNYHLWGDEAVTALHGKNILKFGLPYGFDGRNLHEFSGYYLNHDFLPLLDPWAQFYVAAASLGIFGIHTLGARMLFILLGLAAMIVQYFFVIAYFQDRRLAAINLLLMATSVSYLLFARQCRYFVLGMFLTPLVAYGYTKHRDRYGEILLWSCLFALVFFSNSLIGIFCLGGMAVSFFFLDDRRKSLRFFLKPLPVTVLLIGLFSLWLYKDGFSGTPTNFKNIRLFDFSRIFWLYVKDYNLTQMLPLGMFLILVLAWIKEGLGIQRGHGESLRLRKELSILLWILLFTVAISIFSPQDSSAAYSDVRYAAPVFPMLLLLQALAVEKAYRWRKMMGVLLLFVAVTTNTLTFTPFRMYLYEYIREGIDPFPNSVKVAVSSLQGVVKHDDIILVSPNHMLAPMAFYLGDTLRFCNVVGEDSYNLQKKAARLPKYSYSADTAPDWIIFFGLTADLPHTRHHLRKLNLTEYRMQRIDFFGPDMSRPEIFWRSFKPVREFPETMGIFILQRIRSAPVQ